MLLSSDRLERQSATVGAVHGFTRILGVIIILAVCGLGDVMYIVLMNKHFPSGPLLALCYLGAFTSFLAVGYLLLGKSEAFSPGPQMLAAWIVLSCEVVIIALNIMLVFQDGQSLTGIMQAWLYMAPATPVLSMVGVVVVYYLDREHLEKFKDIELSNWKKEQERNFDRKVHTAHLLVREKQLEQITMSLIQAVDSDASQAHILRYGHEMNKQLLTDVTGMSVREPQIVQSEDVRTTVKHDPTLGKKCMCQACRGK